MLSTRWVTTSELVIDNYNVLVQVVSLGTFLLLYNIIYDVIEQYNIYYTQYIHIYLHTIYIPEVLYHGTVLTAELNESFLESLAGQEVALGLVDESPFTVQLSSAVGLYFLSLERLHELRDARQGL